MKRALAYLKITQVQLEGNLHLAQRRLEAILDSPGNAVYRADLEREIVKLKPEINDFKHAIAILEDHREFKL